MDQNQELILNFFLSELNRIKNAMAQLSQLASNFYGAEAESSIRKACNEEKLPEIEEKIKALRSAFEEQLRLEFEATSNYETYISATKNFNGNASSNDEDHSNDAGHERAAIVSEGNANALPDSSPAPAKSWGPLQDIEVKPLTDDEFADVPKYMKNRATAAQINSIVAKFNAILDKKYRILAAGIKGATSREAKDEFLKYKEEEAKGLKGQRNCTEKELRDSLSPRDVTNLKVAIPILRHCKRIKDIRVGKSTYLTVVPH